MEKSRIIAFLDIETTGLDREKEDILEIGIIKVEDNKIIDQYEKLFFSEKITPFITELTGIDDELVKDKGEFGESVSEINDFLGDVDFVFAHNKKFDESFIKNKTGDLLDVAWLDTIELAKITYPTEKSYSLKNLIKKFRIGDNTEHRALSDALDTFYVFEKLERKLFEFSKTEVKSLIDFLKKKDPLREFFKYYHDKASIIPQKEFRVKKEEYHEEIKNLEKLINKLETPDKFFSEKGKLKQGKDNFQYRVQQQEMANDIYDAFLKRKHFFIEAGTGTGKSFAYLYPAILFNLKQNSKIVISTQTINLQEQVFFKDIPYIEELIGFPIKKAMAKGRGNYVCLRKYFESIREDRIRDEEKYFYMRISRWLNDTYIGDREELNLKRNEMYNWYKVAASSEDCFGQSCPNYKECYYYKQRRKIERSNIIVTNNALLIRDLKSNKKVIPEYEYLIIDEGHNFTNEVVNQFTESLDFKTFGMYLNKIIKRKTGVINKVENFYEGDLFFKDVFIYTEKIKETYKTILDKLLDINDILEKGSNIYKGEVRIKEEIKNSEWYKELKGEMLSASVSLESIKKSLNEILKILSEEETNEALITDLAINYGIVTDKVKFINDFLTMEDENKVYWYRGNSIFIAPIDVSQDVRRLLYEEKDSIIVTSATLTIGNKFEYIINSFGLDQESVEVKKYDSPFDYEKQAKFLVFRDTYTNDQLLNYLSKIVRKVGGGTLILFTNHDILKKAYNYLTEKNPEFTVLADGISGSRRGVIEDFRKVENGVLLGADSFWEGIDLEGDNLKNLIMMKLPFLPPNRPIVEAIMDKMTREGRNNFMNYSVPQAVIKFRQGFGRLIRTNEDEGLFILLDNRVIQKRYGRIFLESLPKMDLKVIYEDKS